MSAVARRSVPAAVREIDSLTDPDYTDAFEIDTSSARPRSPERWARVTFEGAPTAMRWFLRASWRAGLGLRLGPRHSPDHILGWRIVGRATDSVTLELRSWFLYCHLLFWLDDTKLVFSTSIRYERRIGAVIWPPVSILHHRIVSYALRHAVLRPVPCSPARSDHSRASVRRDRIVTFQRKLANPVMVRLGRYLPGQVVLETVGRISGKPRLTPLGGRRDGTTVWIVSEFGRRSNYVRNIEVHPGVRVRIGGTWHTGVAAILPGDDARERLRHLPRYNSLVVRAVGSDLLTVRIELSS